MLSLTQKDQAELRKIASYTPKIRPFKDDSPEARKARVKKHTAPTWQGFSSFCKAYFPMICTDGFSKVHKKAFESIEANKDGLTGIAGFRGMGKTMLFGYIYPIWKASRNDVDYIVHIAAKEHIAHNRTKFIQIQLESNTRLMNDFPRLRIAEAGPGSILLENDIFIEAYSIRQFNRGANSPYTGNRPQLIICDDIDVQENIGNQRIGANKLEKIKGDILAGLDAGKHSRVIWLGNLVHPNYAFSQYEAKLIAGIKQGEPGSRPENRQHLEIGKTKLLRFPIEDTAGNPVWPERYGLDKLNEYRQKHGNTTYQREYLCRSIIEGLIFKNEWFKTWAKLPPKSKIKAVWMYADHAGGTKGCFKAIIVILFDGVHFYMIHCWVRQTHNNAFFAVYYRLFEELQSKYGYKFNAAIEITFGQDRVLSDFARWCGENGMIDITYKIKRIDNKVAKNVRIERLDTVIETGKLLFCSGEDFETVKSQFLSYPTGYIDAPDAVAGCLERFTAYTGQKPITVTFVRY